LTSGAAGNLGPTLADSRDAVRNVYQRAHAPLACFRSGERQGVRIVIMLAMRMVDLVLAALRGTAL
jgi:hypothetical protein